MAVVRLGLRPSTNIGHMLINDVEIHNDRNVVADNKTIRLIEDVWDKWWAVVCKNAVGYLLRESIFRYIRGYDE
ncbi:hypothetical protein [Halomicrococcus sp. NG-SE-24]|uniref:hypothetical protein n=1 Tax=Halomicrococcus sp. NG-SE-24 TaxID=3436928 RepID=UPI003D98F451